MRYIFENLNSNYDQQKGINVSEYANWMNSILRRSEEIGKVELPICSIILMREEDVLEEVLTGEI